MSTTTNKMTNYRWVICAMLFLATTVNYMDRQVLSLTWKDFIAIDFHWSDADYGFITAAFSIFYAFISLFAGKFIDWMGTKKGYIWAIVIWSIGACLHAGCGIAAMWIADLPNEEALRAVRAGTDLALLISTASVWLFLACRIVLATGEAGNFPAAIKVTAEYFPKKDRALATSIFNAGASVGALAAPLTIPILAEKMGWEMAFIIIGAIGFVWAILWAVLYNRPAESSRVNAAELAYIQQDANASVSEEKATKTPTESKPTTTFRFHSSSASPIVRHGHSSWVNSSPMAFGGSSSSGHLPTSPNSATSRPTLWDRHSSSCSTSSSL